MPGLNVMLAYGELSPVSIDGHKGAHRVLAPADAATDVTFFVQVRGEEVNLGLEYRGTSLGQVEAQAMLGEFETELAGAATSDPSAILDPVALATDGDTLCEFTDGASTSRRDRRRTRPSAARRPGGDRRRRDDQLRRAGSSGRSRRRGAGPAREWVPARLWACWRRVTRKRSWESSGSSRLGPPTCRSIPTTHSTASPTWWPTRGSTPIVSRGETSEAVPDGVSTSCI